MALEADIRALPDLFVGEQVALCDQDPDTVNSASTPDRVSQPTRTTSVGGGRMVPAAALMEHDPP